MVLFWKNVEFLEKRPYFRVDMAKLGKYCTAGYGQIGVYKVLNTAAQKLVKVRNSRQFLTFLLQKIV